MDLRLSDLLYADNAFAVLAVMLDKLSDSGLFADDNAVAEENREGFVSDNISC